MRNSALQTLASLRQSAARSVGSTAARAQPSAAACTHGSSASSLCFAGSAAAKTRPLTAWAALPQLPTHGRSTPCRSHLCDVAATGEGRSHQCHLVQHRSSVNWLAASAASSASRKGISSMYSLQSRPAPCKQRQGSGHAVQPWTAQHAGDLGQHGHRFSGLPWRSMCTSWQPQRFDSICGGLQQQCPDLARSNCLRLADPGRGQMPCRVWQAQQTRGFATPRSSGGAWSKGFQVPHCCHCDTTGYATLSGIRASGGICSLPGA